MNPQPAFTTSSIRSDNIERVWMKSRCSADADVNDINTIRCTSPDIANPLDYLVPVSDLNTNTTYKNRYCANCNGVNASNDVLNWDTELMCNGSLTLTDHHLYDRMKELNCSLFFVPPAGISVDECDEPGYSIAECNATGLWPQYDEMIEKACHAFVDPFNMTYQNYFCYVCNTDQLFPQHDWYCPTIDRVIDEVMPSFVALINLEAVKKWQNEETLQCNLFNQFPDEKKVSIPPHRSWNLESDTMK